MQSITDLAWSSSSKFLSNKKAKRAPSHWPTTQMPVMNSTGPGGPGHKAGAGAQFIPPCG